MTDKYARTANSGYKPLLAAGLRISAFCGVTLRSKNTQ
jgi:hypothetical protein